MLERAVLVCVTSLVTLLSSFCCYGDETLTITYQGLERHAVIYRADTPADATAPVMLVLAGRGESLDDLRRNLPFDAVAGREHFVTVYPEAIEQQWNFMGENSIPVPMVGGAKVDDVGFIRELVDQLIAKKVADPKRVYVTGVSRGGLMAYALACLLPDKFAAATALLSGMTNGQRERCHPGRPVPLLVIAGTNDALQSYDGWITPDGRLLSVPETLENWRVLHGCKGQTVRFMGHKEHTDPSRIRLVEWTECSTPDALRLYRVNGGGHQIPSLTPANADSEKRYGHRNGDIEASDEIWDFAKLHTLN